MTDQDPVQTPDPPAQGALTTDRTPSAGWQTVVGITVVVLALLLGWGTWQIPVSAHDALDGGARLAPRLSALALLVCGSWLIWEARHGGWRQMAPWSGRRAQITPWAWVSAGILLGALLLPHSGFVVAATLCYVLALQGLRMAATPECGLRGLGLLRDLAVGLCVAAAVYGLFVYGLAIDLPGGWLSWM